MTFKTNTGKPKKQNTKPPLPRCPEGPAIFQLLAIKRGIKFYLDTGMKVNTQYTPANMTRTASNITGRAYTSGNLGMRAALADLEEMLAARDAAIAESAHA